MDKIRKCTNPECDWKGTRGAALGPYERPQLYWLCPECGGKIENDDELSRRKRKEENEDIREQGRKILQDFKYRGTGAMSRMIDVDAQRLGAILNLTDDCEVVGGHNNKTWSLTDNLK